MKTTLLAGLLGAGAVLVAVAFLARSWRALALVLPLLIYLAIGALVPPPRIRLAVTRTLSRDRTSAGQPVDVRLTLTNRADQRATLEVFDEIPRALEVAKGRPHTYVALRPRDGPRAGDRVPQGGAQPPDLRGRPDQALV